MGFQRYGVDLVGPDLVAFAQSVGAVGHRVKAVTELSPILQHCITTPAVHLVEVPINYAVSDKLQVNPLPIDYAVMSFSSNQSRRL